MQIDPTLRPKGRALNDFLPLSPVEDRLLVACWTGKQAKFGDGFPKTRTDGTRIRAPFLRFLALGGDDQAPVHEQGVQIQGAWIEKVLDLEAARVPSNLTLFSVTVQTPSNRWGSQERKALILSSLPPRGGGLGWGV